MGSSPTERYSADWNGVWDARTSRFDGGWIVEMRIPFKTLRYRRGQTQTWQIQFRRHVAGKSEWTNLTALNPNWRVSGWNRFSLAATLAGLEVPPPANNLELKPYAISRVTTDRTQQSGRRRRCRSRLGLRREVRPDNEPDG